ncbi:Centrosomal protein of 295 kDa [Eumeta japonica]|uniref:Centrosomal protein of 295 kDa n=1 Tax=Eumeta variegata TaxID=151549 RepID=A0A4C2A6D2_EUMVA|nr:Centrosomal protein of 295 kDa [Eumeta japonica]
MSFDDEALKTNEFLRRRKLRLQQVREQSKDIAKKIRQKTRNETSRYLKHLDAKKHKEHFLDQEKIVNHLENLHVNQMKQVGSSHRSASHVNQNEQPTEKLDLSKERGKVAVAHLRQKKQQELDHKKLLLDRKLRAREAANELSRDKSSIIANKPQEKLITTKQGIETPLEKDNEKSPHKVQPSVQFDNTTSGEQVHDIKETPQKDKDVQWNAQNLPRELEPNVPELKLHKTDKEESIDTNLTTSQTASGGTKKSNLFAVSEEMPSSLRGGLIHRVSKPPVSTKSSLNLVSEYLQTRHMRLREHPVIPSKPIGNLDCIRETLMHARAVRSKAKPIERNKTDGSSSSIARNLVTIYNHTTRDVQDVPLDSDKFVTRESQHDEDAYSQALKESSHSERQGIHLKKTQTTRSRVAMAKQSVEKEYKDTIAFLNSLPKDKQVKALKKAYMDEYEQNAQRENHQRKMQQEFKKIERQCKKQVVMKAGRRKITKIADENDLNVADCMKEQYSWIPSPENDISLAVHKIPNKTENMQILCKQNEVNGYHEYRSRHKHTPPTKDMAGVKTKKQSKTVIEEQIQHQSDEFSSTVDDNSSFDESQKKKPAKKLKKQPSASREKIIIYKILSNRNENKGHESNSDSVNDIMKSLTSIDRVLQKSADDENDIVNKTKTGKKTELSQPKAHQIDEDLYKKANPQWVRHESILNCYAANIELWEFTTDTDPWENGNSTHFDRNDEGSANEKICKQCQYRKHKDVVTKEKPVNKGPLQWEVDDSNVSRQMSSRSCDECKRMNAATSNLSTNVEKPVAMSSLESKASKIVKTVHTHSEAELIKLMENDDEKNKFYVGASGVLKDEDYEVIIQLHNIEEVSTNPIISEKTTKDHSNVCASKTFETEAQLNKDLSDQKLITQYPKPSMTTINNGKSPDVNGNHQYTLSNETPVPVPNIPQVALDLPKSNDLVTQATNTSQPRPLITACTQTSGRSSPENRPMYVQMSSSTSTTYLSPPERVRPDYLRYKYAEPTNHIETIPQMSYREKKCKHKVLNQEKKYVNNKNTFSKKIETAINIASADLGHIYNSKKIKQMYRNGSPDNEVQKNFRSKTTQSESELSSKKEMKYRYHHPAHDDVSEELCKICLGLGKFKKRNVKNGTSQKCTCNTKVPLRSCKVSLRHMEKSPTVRQQLKNKSQLNPVLKNYVRELLNLNQEGLKAIEIAALQCSSVTTPGSSVINEPSNKPISKKSNCSNIMLTKLEKILSQEKFQNVSKKHEKEPSSISSENNIEIPSKVVLRRQLKKKRSGQTMGHKIKNLNISKTVLGSKKNLKGQSKKQNPSPFDDSSDNNIIKKGTNDTKNSQLKVHRPKVRSISSPSPRTIDQPFKLKKTKTISDIVHNQTKHITSGETNSFESHSKKKFSKHTVICNNTAKIDNITVTAAPDKITIILKPPIEVKSMAKQIKAVIDDKLIQIPPKGEMHASNIDGIDNSAVSETQTNWNKVQELELMKFAQNKLHNMEKIANLTDKCTKRLSNLARVLEEVRKSKSTAYSHISTTDTSSEIEMKIDKNIHSDKSKTDLYFHKNGGAIETKKQLLSAPLESNYEKTNYTESSPHNTHKADYTNQITENIEENSPKYFHTDVDRMKLIKLKEQSLMSVATNTESIDNIFLNTENIRLSADKESQLITSTAVNIEQICIPVHASVNIENSESDVPIAMITKQIDNDDYVPMLSDIPRPLNAPNSFLNKDVTIHDEYSMVESENCSTKSDLHHGDGTGRSRSKPPPALSRVILKKSDEILVPHELSTVMEVDSPMSMKYKKQSPTNVNDSKLSHSETLNDEILLESDNEKKSQEQNQADTNLLKKPDVIEKELISELMKDSSELKMKLMNLNEFNEIILKPFMTMEEYAKQCNVGQLDEGSNYEDLSRAATIDEISSLNSDASMPDIVAELLKRNVISEPFHFDYPSHPNSTTLSSESSLPIFALSKAPKEKSKSKTAHKSKEHMIASETSDNLSMSSYPDLENAFKNFGIGWASSTLKRTKQTLYLSSSTSTSSTSNKYTPKKYDNTGQVLLKTIDSKKISDKESDKRRQNAGQQTSTAKSMTDSKFLVNESGEKITLSNKFNRDESEEHFTSLYSTNLPSETNLHVTYPPSVKHSEENVRTNTRQRTSTPVQLFKSETYNSSSSSNNRSDGLFSNTDELSSVKLTSSSVKNHSSSEKDGLTIPNYSLRVRKENRSDSS